MHTHFKTGKRVLLTYRDGRPPEVHKYVDRLRDSILLEGGIKVRVALLRNISIYKDRRVQREVISRQAKHGAGEILGTGLREKCEANGLARRIASGSWAVTQFQTADAIGRPYKGADAVRHTGKPGEKQP